MAQTNLNLQNLWSTTCFVPNPQQKKAIIRRSGPIFITAGPSSGKTRVLLWRTLNLIVFRNIDPSEIFLSTFTEKAARQLKEGLRNLLGIVTNLTDRPFDIAQRSIGTVHSICKTL